MWRIAERSLSVSARRVRWGLLGFSAAPLIGAYCYSQGYRAPLWTCPILHLTGIPCPTCGMTRSFTAIAQGNLSQAVNDHLFGPILFAGFSIAAVHIMLELLIKKPIAASYVAVVGDWRFLLSSLLAVLIYHSYRLCQLAHSGVLAASFAQSPLAEWLSLMTNFSS